MAEIYPKTNYRSCTHEIIWEGRINFCKICGVFLPRYFSSVRRMAIGNKDIMTRHGDDPNDLYQQMLA